MDQTPPPPPSTSSDVRTWCVLCHASALAGLFRAVGWSHSRPVDYLAGQTGRFHRNRRERKGVAQFSNIDADLQFDRRHSLSGADWICNIGDTAPSEPSAGDCGIYSSRRRKVLSLSAGDSADQVICSVIPSGARDLTQGNEITLTGLCDRARR